MVQMYITAIWHPLPTNLVQRCVQFRQHLKTAFMWSWKQPDSWDSVHVQPAFKIMQQLHSPNKSVWKYTSQTCIWSHPYQNPRVAGVLFRVTWPIIMRRVSSLGFNAVSFSWNCKCKLQMCKRPTLSSPKMIFIFYFSFANVRLIDVIDIRRPVKKTRQNWLWNHEK